MVHRWTGGSSSQVVLRVLQVARPVEVALVLEGRKSATTPQYIGVYAATSLSRSGNFFHPHQSFEFIGTVNISGMESPPENRLKGCLTFILHPAISYLRLDMNGFLEDGDEPEKHMVSIALDERETHDSPSHTTPVKDEVEDHSIIPEEHLSRERVSPVYRTSSQFSSPVSEMRYGMINPTVAGWLPSNEKRVQHTGASQDAVEFIRLREAVSHKRKEIALSTVKLEELEARLASAVVETQSYLAEGLRTHNLKRHLYAANRAALEAADTKL